MIQIYYGYGKGKTTAAIGAGMRAKGAKMSVSLVQFLKNNKSSELSVVPFDVFEAPEGLSFNPDKEYQPWVDGAVEYILNCSSDMLILDEFLDVIGAFISVDKAQEILKNTCAKEIIITGHKKVEEIFALADYITLMQKEKHPYDKGINARKGIEY
ncbi:MAG: cob(I)yrinic acid a,c-diamide adenosyltransferase [Eubacterium sp.]